MQMGIKASILQKRQTAWRMRATKQEAREAQSARTDKEKHTHTTHTLVASPKLYNYAVYMYIYAISSQDTLMEYPERMNQ